MKEHKLFIVYGAGNDTIGLVKRIAGDIFKLKGNILDMRQDVMHGLFTVFIVVDLSGSDSSVTEFESVIRQISLDTGLKLNFEKYYPSPRNPEKKNILLVLLGADREGIIALISESLSRYKINIEFSQMIAREGIFLMELLADISQCVIPVANLKTEIDIIMQKMKIKAMYQFDNVFNKKRRMIIFNYKRSLIDDVSLSEILKLSGITEQEFARYYPKTNSDMNQVYNSLRLLDGMPFEILENITNSVKVKPATIELVQTLKVMGYKISFISNALCPLSKYLKHKLDMDSCFEFPLNVDPDGRTVKGDSTFEEFAGECRKNDPVKIMGNTVIQENISSDDMVIVDDSMTDTMIPGIGLDFNMKIILEYLNNRVITRENLAGILGSFGALISK
jgi:predicted amino acid-binding ACT domain protein/phosphoserine phosphatase